MPCENSPLRVVGGRHIANGDELGKVVWQADTADTRPRHSCDGKAVDDNVGCQLQIDTVRRGGISLIDDRARLGIEFDWGSGSAARVEVESNVVAGASCDAVAGADNVGRMMKCPPRRRARAGSG